MIEIINLCKSFGNQKVLDNVNLTINTGETTVIIGRSGCGKSVLLKHIIGLMKPDSGQIFIDGKDITKLYGKALNETRMKFGMLFQNSALFDSLPVWANVAFSMLEHTTRTRPAIMHRVRECLGFVGLEGVEDLKPAALSGGMRKRVGLARCIAFKPEIILYDEPTTGLDPIMADSINTLIRGLHDKLKITSVAVTHDMTSAYKMADKVAMLYGGKIIAVGTPEEVKNTKNPIVKQFIYGEAEGPITRNT
ncbi:MAG: ABC transporter ATP-binding protein [Omnitrophica bacterium]|nr:ABC transporter ATP-binding protein [Candidatus Omnitrophota bacterium]